MVFRPTSIYSVIHAVDGRNPAPADVVDIPVFIGCYTSEVVQEFFHQQYLVIFVKYNHCNAPTKFAKHETQQGHLLVIYQS